MAASTANDASLFNLVHDLAKPGDSEDERRRRLRQSYPTVQMIAPYRDGHLPAREDFVPVQCQDLSTGGFSFILPGKPDFDRLVCALASSTQVIYLTAAIANCAPVESDLGPQFRIGCRFLGRVLL